MTATRGEVLPSAGAARPSLEGRGFISYRRDDSDALATLLKTRLEAALPHWKFFLDFGSIPAGTAFKRVIEEGVKGADLVIVLIDKDWIGERKAPGGRIHEADDFIRFEVATALAEGKRTIPVLVNDVRMPPGAALPKDVAPITDLNAVELRLSRFEDDFLNLVQAIAGHIPDLAQKASRLRVLGDIATGTALGSVVAGAGLLSQFLLTGRPLSYWIGSFEAGVAVVLCIVIGAAGWRAARRPRT